MKLFYQPYVANQRRNCNMGTFFSHKNTSVPPSLSKDGKDRSADKADLLDSLYDVCNTQDGIVVEGPVLVNMNQPTGQRTFKEYFEERLEALLQEKLDHVNRLKMTTHKKRGNGSRKKVTGTAIMPRRWDIFLRNSQNKASLFQFISNCIKSKLFPELKQKKMATIIL